MGWLGASSPHRVRNPWCIVGDWNPCQPALALPLRLASRPQLVLCDLSTCCPASEKASSSVRVSKGPPSMPCILGDQAGTPKEVVWRERCP